MRLAALLSACCAATEPAAAAAATARTNETRVFAFILLSSEDVYGRPRKRAIVRGTGFITVSAASIISEFMMPRLE